MNTNLNIYRENHYLTYISNPCLNPESKKRLGTRSYGGVASKNVKRPTEEAVKESMAEIQKYYMDKARGPNVFHALSIPQDILHGYNSLVKAEKSKNKAAILDSKLKLVTTTVNSVYIVSSIVAMLMELGFIFSYAAPIMEKIVPITGIIASTAAGAIECRNFKRQVNFISKCTKDLKLLSSDLTNEKRVFFLEKYLGNASGMKMHTLAKLANRVSPWFAEKVAIELPKLLDDIKQSKDLALQQRSIEKAIDLLKNTKIQAQKKLITQSLTLFATALIIAGFACVLFGIPLIIPITLFVANLVISATNHILYNGVNKHVGWSFNFKECTPAWIQAIRDKNKAVSLEPSTV